MKLSKNGYRFISNLEGVRTDAYYDTAHIPTIGIGFIQINGVKVKIGDKMSLDEIEMEFSKQIVSYENAVNNLVSSSINQSQFDALVSFSFNCGVNALKTSTLLKKVNTNPNDITIKNEFLKWNKSGGKEVSGLTNRRNKEAILYFTK